MTDLTYQEQVAIILNQKKQWLKAQFDAIVARRVSIKIGDHTTAADAIIARAEVAILALEEELTKLSCPDAPESTEGESDAPS